MLGDAYFGPGIGPVWRDGVACTGNEHTLANCTGPDWGVKNCTHGQDAGVICGTNILN